MLPIFLLFFFDLDWIVPAWLRPPENTSNLSEIFQGLNVAADCLHPLTSADRRRAPATAPDRWADLTVSARRLWSRKGQRQS